MTTSHDGNPKRVLIVQDYIPEYRRGFFQALHLLCQGRGIDVRVATREKNPFAARADFVNSSEISYIEHISARHLRFAGRDLMIRRLRLRSRPCELLILEQARRNLDVYWLLVPKWFRPVPRIALWGHGRDFVESPRWFRRAILKAVTRRADHVFAYTPGGTDAVVAAGVDSHRVTTVMNANDTKSLRTDTNAITNTEFEGFCESHDLGSKTVLYLGSLDTAKQVPFLLAAFKKAHNKDPSLRLLVAGDGPLRHLVEGPHPYAFGIRFLGHTRGPSKAMALRAARLLAIPGRIGLVAVDALAAGVPILSTRRERDAPEAAYLEDGRSVFHTDPTVEAFADGITRFAADQGLQAAMQLDVPRVSQELNVDRMAAHFLRGLEDALNRD